LLAPAKLTERCRFRSVSRETVGHVSTKVSGTTLLKFSRGSVATAAIRYVLDRWESPKRYCDEGQHDDGRLDLPIGSRGLHQSFATLVHTQVRLSSILRKPMPSEE
jgi:hypothetical protein